MTVDLALSWHELVVSLDLDDTDDLTEQVAFAQDRRADMLAHIRDIQAGAHRSLSEKLHAVALARDEIGLCEGWLDSVGASYTEDGAS